MIRGLFIFFSSLILLSSTQFKLSWIENDPGIQRNPIREIFAADQLTFESVEHPGQLGDIRLLKQKTTKLRTTNSNCWFITESISNQFCFGRLFQQAPIAKNRTGHVKYAGALPLYLELNKIII
ncbi:MAG: hypothetical protein IPO32_13810 [Crocinitomicaceae bacterium]|nr:hypothetical protein [Crocinitomicaceae bacterium]